MRWLDGITNSTDMSLSKLLELVMGRGSLVCCSPWGRKELYTTEQMNCTELKTTKMILVRPLMTNLQMTVRDDYAVSACSPLSLPTHTCSVYKSFHPLLVREEESTFR